MKKNKEKATHIFILAIFCIIIISLFWYFRWESPFHICQCSSQETPFSDKLIYFDVGQEYEDWGQKMVCVYTGMFTASWIQEGFYPNLEIYVIDNKTHLYTNISGNVFLNKNYEHGFIMSNGGVTLDWRDSPFCPITGCDFEVKVELENGLVCYDNVKMKALHIVRIIRLENCKEEK